MNTNARVTLTIEVLARSHWGETCTCKQVNDQAISDAIGQLNSMVAKHGLGAKIIGQPRVTMVTTEIVEK